MKLFWSSNLVTLVNQKSTTSSCIDNFCFCLSINKNGRIIRFQWMNQTTKRKAPFGWAVLTRTTRKDKYRKYSEMRNALKYRDQSVMRWTIRFTVVQKSFTLGSYNLTKTYCQHLSDKIKTQSQVFFGLIKMVWLVQNCRSNKCL